MCVCDLTVAFLNRPECYAQVDLRGNTGKSDSANCCPNCMPKMINFVENLRFKLKV